MIADEDDPLARLHRFTSEYYRMCRPSTAADLSGDESAAPATVSVMADFAQQLLTQHPKEAAQAFVPLVSRSRSCSTRPPPRESIRSGLDHRRITGVVLQAVMFNAFADTISASSVRVDAGRRPTSLWELLLDGLGTGTRG